MALIDNQLRYLTELIGECYHTKTIPVGGCCNCKKCNSFMPTNRTFTTPDDFFAVVRAIDHEQIEDSFYAMKLDNPTDISWGLQHPTFIENFMRAVCRMGGVE